MKEKDFRRTQEYQDVFSYITNVLCNEFPTQEFTANYLILSILDNPRCHANMILDNVLMSESLDYLRQYYHSELVRQKNKPIIDNKGQKVDKELATILSCSVEEAKSFNAQMIGTEHILLALLNPNYSFKSSDGLFKCGLQYDYIRGQCIEYTENNEKKVEKNKQYINNNSNSNIPLKSEVHSKAFISNGDTPNIKRYTINLHEEIAKGHYDKLIGREDILNNIVKVLSRRKKNNVILVGKPGVGRTSIGYRLAEMIDSGNVPEILSGKQVIMLDVMALVSGTHLRGMFEERVDGLFKELKGNQNYILFIDDMQNVVRNGGKDKDGDLTDIIGKILTEGDVRVVGTISFKDYRNGIELNSTLSTKLQKIIVEPSTKEETFEILKSNKSYYESFHHVKFDENVLRKAINLAKRYITNNSLPDSALDVIDLTGASLSMTNKQEESIKLVKEKLSNIDEEKKNAMNTGNFELLDELVKKESSINKELSDIKKEINKDDSSWIIATEDDIAETVSTMTNIPVAKLNANNRETILHIDEILKKDVVGQDEAIEEISKAIKRAKAGFGDKSKVMATLLCIGQSGVGKCVCGDTKINIRNKITGEMKQVSIEEFKNLLL